MNTVCIIQARMSSKRLPGKVLEYLVANKTMLECVIERVKQASLIDHVVVATSDDVSDDAIFYLCEKLDVTCFRGALNDVLKRYYDAATLYKADYVVRVTADCPLIDFNIIDKIIKTLLNGNYAYVSNTLMPTYPDGLDVEAFSYVALKSAHNKAKLLSEREHVTLFFKNNPDQYALFNIVQQDNFSNLRWTVDEKIDLELIRIVYSKLYQGKNNFLYQDILALLDENTELKNKNMHIERDEGLKRSLSNDREIING